MLTRLERRILAFLLSLVMVSTAFFPADLTTYAQEADVVSCVEDFVAAGDRMETVVEGADGQNIYQFVPEVSGHYHFYSQDSGDTYGYLYDENHNLLCSDNDSGDDFNFSMDVVLEAGNTYYLEVGFFEDGKEGAIIWYIEPMQEDNEALDQETVALEQEAIEPDEKISEQNTESESDIVDVVMGDVESLSASDGDYTYNVLSDNNVEIIGYMGSASSLSIPDTISGKKVTSIGQYAFNKNTTLQSITIPNTVVRTQYMSFANCENLKTVTFAETSTLQIIGKGTFYNCQQLEQMKIPDSVSIMKEYVFGGCPALKTVTLGERLTNIGDRAFYRSGIQTVVIPNSVTKMGVGVFSSCETLSSVTLGKGLTEISEKMFYSCKSLKSISIPSNISYIGWEAFRGSGLQSLVLPDTVTAVDKDAFAKCEDLKSVKIGEGLTNISDFVFYGCSSLENLTIGTKVQKIKAYAFAGNKFAGNKAFTSVTIPKSVTELEYNVFESCTALSEIIIPDALEKIGGNTFDDTLWYGNKADGLVYAGKVLYKYKGTMPENTTINIESGTLGIAELAFDGQVNLKSVSIPKGVTNIGAEAFRGCSGLTSVTIPEGVTSIGNEAFRGCSNLTSVIIPDSVTYIGESAFRGCSGLTSMTIPEGVTSIGNEAFRGCSNLTSVIIPDSVTYIGDFAFEGCSSLTSVTISKGVMSIGESAFRGCSSLTSVNIPKGVTDIGNSAFENCCSLASVNIPEGVTGIGWGAFRGCSGLTSVTIPEGVTSISGSAFYGCSSLSSVIIPDSVASIGNSAFDDTLWYNNKEDGLVYAGKLLYKYKGTMPESTIINIESGTLGIVGKAFYGQVNLKEVSVPEGVTNIGAEAFRGCSSLGSVNIPDSVTSIGNSAFYGCSSLGSIMIPEGVTNIEYYTFYGCSSLSSVTIPDSVSSIGSSAFSGCSSLTSIIIPEGVASIWYDTFRGCSGLSSVTIPGSVTYIDESAFSGCSDLIIYCLKNSSAQAYAERKGIPYQLIGELAQLLEFITAQKTKTTYQVGEPLNINDLTVAAYYSDRTTSEAVSNYTTNAADIDMSKAGQKTLRIIYTENDITVETTLIILVNEKTIPQPQETYTVTFDANGGKNLSNSSVSVTQGAAIGILPSVTRIGYNFVGWYTAKSGGSKVTADAKITKSQMLYARWQINTYTVKFNQNGGTKLSKANVTVDYNKTIKTLPTVQKKGYAFDGWYTKKTGGSKVTSSTKVTKDQTLYARWSKVTKPASAKKPTLKSSKAGQLTVSYSKVTGAKGYEITYSTSKSFAKKITKTTTSTSLKKEIKSLKKGTTYYVKIRAYKVDSAGNKVYGDYGKAATVKIKK